MRRPHDLLVAVALLVFLDLAGNRAHAQSSPAPNQWAYLQDVATGHYMSAVASPDAGLPGQLQLLPLDLGDHQLFRLEDQGGGVIALRSKLLPKRVITTSRTNYASDAEYKQPGLILWLYDWVKGGNQTWRLEKIRKEGNVDVVRLQNKHSGLYVGMNADGWLEHAIRDQAREWRVYAADDPPRPRPGQLEAVFLEPLTPQRADQALAPQANGTIAVQTKKGFDLSSQEPKDPAQHFMVFPMHDGTTVFLSTDGIRCLRWERRPDGTYALSMAPLAFDGSRRFQRVAQPFDAAFSIQIPGTDQLLTINGGGVTFAKKGIGTQTFGVVAARLYAVWRPGNQGVLLRNELEPEAVQAYWTFSQPGSITLATQISQRIKWPESTRSESKSFDRHDPLATSGTLKEPHSTVRPYHLGLFSGASLRWLVSPGAAVHWYRIVGTRIPDYVSGRSEWLFMTKHGLSRYATGGFDLKVPSCRQACWKGDSTPADMMCVGSLCAKDEKELTTRMSYMAFAIAELAANVVSAGSVIAAKLSAKKVLTARTTRQILAKAIKDVGSEAASRGMDVIVGPAEAHLEEAIIARFGFAEGNLLAAALSEEPTGIYNVVRAFYLPSCDCNWHGSPPPPSTTAPKQAYPFKLQTGTGLQEADGKYAFAVLRNGDLMAIMKSGTGSKSTEVHILTAASGYKKFSLHTGTAQPETDARHTFAALPNGDLMVIMKSGTGSKSTEVHILTAASGYKKFSLHTGTPVEETDAKTAFAVLPNRDLMVIRKSGTGSKSTEVHILTAASKYQQFRLHTGTALPETDDAFEFGALDKDRLVAIKKKNTGTRSTEVHILGP